MRQPDTLVEVFTTTTERAGTSRTPLSIRDDAAAPWHIAPSELLQSTEEVAVRTCGDGNLNMAVINAAENTMRLTQ